MKKLFCKKVAELLGCLTNFDYLYYRKIEAPKYLIVNKFNTHFLKKVVDFLGGITINLYL